MRAVAAFLWLTFVASTASAQTESEPEESVVARIFWKGVEALNLIFKAVGSLGGSPDAGEVWIVDLNDGSQRRVGGTDLMWPVLAPDGDAIFAVRDGDVVRFGLSGGDEVPVENSADWRKLIGVMQDGSILGIVEGSPRARPALIKPSAELELLPAPETDEDRRNVSLLLQQDRAYADDRALLVRRSARGGRGFDVFLVTAPDRQRNLSDCGDERCGQPSLSPDGEKVLYVRATRR